MLQNCSYNANHEIATVNLSRHIAFTTFRTTSRITFLDLLLPQATFWCSLAGFHASRVPHTLKINRFCILSEPSLAHLILPWSLLDLFLTSLTPPWPLLHPSLTCHSPFLWGLKGVCKRTRRQFSLCGITAVDYNADEHGLGRQMGCQ